MHRLVPRSTVHLTVVLRLRRLERGRAASWSESSVDLRDRLGQRRPATSRRASRAAGLDRGARRRGTWLITCARAVRVDVGVGAAVCTTRPSSRSVAVGVPAGVWPDDVGHRDRVRPPRPGAAQARTPTTARATSSPRARPGGPRSRLTSRHHRPRRRAPRARTAPRATARRRPPGRPHRRCRARRSVDGRRAAAPMTEVAPTAAATAARREHRLALGEAQEVRAELLGGLVAVVRRLRERAHRHALERLGHRGAQVAQQRRRVADVHRRHGDGRVADERRAAREHLEEHDAERVQVAAAVDDRAFCLLGREVRGGAHHRARHREALLGAHGLGDPEVGDLHLPVVGRAARCRA